MLERARHLIDKRLPIGAVAYLVLTLVVLVAAVAIVSAMGLFLWVSERTIAK